MLIISPAAKNGQRHPEIVHHQQHLGVVIPKFPKKKFSLLSVGINSFLITKSLSHSSRLRYLFSKCNVLAQKVLSRLS